MKSLAIISLLIVCSAVKVPYDMDISWEVDGDTVTFTYSIAVQTFNTYGWSGMGIKQCKDGPKMANGDYVSIVYRNEQGDWEMADRHGVRNGSPKTDEEQDGEFSLTDMAYLGIVDSYAKFTWKRKLDTDDDMDTELKVDKHFYLQWAIGDYEAGVIKHHKESASKTVIFTADSSQPNSEPECIIEPEEPEEIASFLSMAN